MSENAEKSVSKEILKKVRLIEIKTRGLVNEMFSGEYHSAFKGRGIEFSEVREYQFGDDIRNIDWNVSARMGHPYVKVFEEERELIVMLLVDMSASGDFGSDRKTKNELAAELSAVLAFSALKNNDKVGMIIFTDDIELFIPPKKGKSHVLRLLREIIAFKPKGKGTNIGKAVDYLNRVMKKRAIVFLISDFWDSGFDSGLKIAGAHHDLITVRLTDRREHLLPKANLLYLYDPESGGTAVVDLGKRELRNKYQSIVQKHFRQFSDNMKRYNIDLIDVNTSRDYIDSLVKFFRMRGRKR
ncbi:DUF58 domain-containing protein [bacterium]|nr:DUF58 domain-containing protein [FCB group bacterium]MBL7191847.1 DUF58 domain-containing protein [bacterium]